MVRVCAWCQKFLGLKEPLSQVDVSHGICASCSARQQVEDFPILVVSRSRADTLPILQDLLGSAPEIKIVVDRRHNERRRDRPSVDEPDGRRLLRDRRERVSLVVT
jgi:hypothetical protein